MAMYESDNSSMNEGGDSKTVYTGAVPKTNIVKPGSMVMMNITVEDYEREFWPKLSDAVNQLLVNRPGEYIPVSYEQMYSCVYKCVCKQFSERLYSDLVQQITTHLEQLSIQLQACEANITYVNNFHFALNRYLQALHGIVPVFNYMNRFYIESKLKTDLNIELRKLFVIHVADRHIDSLLPLLDKINSHPFTVPPSVMASLVKNLYLLKPEYAQLRLQLFAKYIPNVLPPCSVNDLDHYIQEAQQMQRDLLTHPEFIGGDHARKRHNDSDTLRQCTNVENFVSSTENFMS